MDAARAYLTGTHFPMEALQTRFGSERREAMITGLAANGVDTWVQRIAFGSSASRQMAAARAIELHMGPLFERPYAAQAAARGADDKAAAALVNRIEMAELKLDIDMTDYTTLREACGCGQNKRAVCARCMRALGFIADVIDTVAQHAYGWNDVQFVFSGSRGLHVWFLGSPERTMTLTEFPQSRVFYAQMLSGILGPVENGKGVFVEKLARECGEISHAVARLKEETKDLIQELNIDAGVTTGTTHLMRSPFSPHTGTGLIATPFLPPRRDPENRWFSIEGNRNRLAPSCENIARGEGVDLELLERGVSVWKMTPVV